jgi:hypothetical protein
MIKDVGTWLGELKSLRLEFQSACVQNIDFEIERTLYYSALVMRKFSETPFVGRSFLSPVLEGQKFAPAIGSVDGLNWIDAKSHFDFRNPISARVSLLDLCNTLIHSRFLDWLPGEGEVQKIVAAGGMRSGVEAIGFSPAQYSSLLQRIENYKFKRLPLRPVRRTA